MVDIIICFLSLYYICMQLENRKFMHNVNAAFLRSNDPVTLSKGRMDGS